VCSRLGPWNAPYTRISSEGLFQVWQLLHSCRMPFKKKKVPYTVITVANNLLMDNWRPKKMMQLNMILLLVRPYFGFWRDHGYE
jgi:hypothetical protein